MKRIKKDDPFIQKSISLIAKSSNISYETAELIFEIGLEFWKNPYHTIEYLLIKSIDSRLSRMVVRQGDSVLNVGCGYPINEIILSSWGAKKIVGIDTDESVVKEGEEVLDELKMNRVKLYVVDALEVSQYFPKESFDVVVSFSAIEHANSMENYEKWVTNMCDVSKRHAVLTTSNRNNYLIHLMSNLFKVYSEYFFAPKTIRELFLKNDFRVVHFETNTLICYEYFPLPFRVKYNKRSLELNMFLNELQRKILKGMGGRMGFVCEKSRKGEKT